MAEQVTSVVSVATSRELDRLNTKTTEWKFWYDGNDNEIPDDRDECGDYLLELDDIEWEDDGDDSYRGDDNDPEGNTIASFQLHGMVNCCGIVVLTEVSATPRYMPHVLRLAVDVARNAGYGMIVTTHTVTSTVGLECIKNRLWVELTRFTNPRTGHRLGMWGKKL